MGGYDITEFCTQCAYDVKPFDYKWKANVPKQMGDSGWCHPALANEKLVLSYPRGEVQRCPMNAGAFSLGPGFINSNITQTQGD